MRKKKQWNPLFKLVTLFDFICESVYEFVYGFAVICNFNTFPSLDSLSLYDTSLDLLTRLWQHSSSWGSFFQQLSSLSFFSHLRPKLINYLRAVSDLQSIFSDLQSVNNFSQGCTMKMSEKDVFSIFSFFIVTKWAKVKTKMLWNFYIFYLVYWNTKWILWTRGTKDHLIPRQIKQNRKLNIFICSITFLLVSMC